MNAEHSEWVTTFTLLDNLRSFGNQAAWARVTDRFIGPLKAFALRLGVPPQDLDDAAQEVLIAFAEAYRAGQYDRSKGRLSSWLFGIAYRQIANFRRKRMAAQRQEQRGADSSFWGEVPDEHTAHQTWAATWDTHVLDACMKQARTEVSDNTYRAFEMTVRQGLTPEKAAEVLGMTRNAVYVAKHRVLNRLQELIREFDEDPAA